MAHNGTRRCQRHCSACPYVWETNLIQFPTHYVPVRGSFTCESKRVIYAIECTRCGTKYIGQTKRKLGTRIAEHIRSIENRGTGGVARHFNKPGHSEAHFRCAAFEKHPEEELLAREKELIKSLCVGGACMNVLEVDNDSDSEFDDDTDSDY